MQLDYLVSFIKFALGIVLANDISGIRLRSIWTEGMRDMECDRRAI